jgi:hypothetical protein
MWYCRSNRSVITELSNRGIQTQSLMQWDCCCKRCTCSPLHHVPPVSAKPSLCSHRFPPASSLPVPAVHSTVHKSAWLWQTVYLNTTFITSHKRCFWCGFEIMMKTRHKLLFSNWWTQNWPRFPHYISLLTHCIKSNLRYTFQTNIISSSNISSTINVLPRPRHKASDCATYPLGTNTDKLSNNLPLYCYCHSDLRHSMVSLALTPSSGSLQDSTR